MNSKDTQRQKKKNNNSSGRAIVLDYGSAFSKIGYAGLESPKIIRPTIIGQKNTDSTNSYLVGIDALKQRDQYQLSHPIKKRQIDDWKAVRFLLQNDVFKVLNANPSYHPLMYVTSSKQSKEEKKKIATYLFEEFDFPGIYLAKQPLMPLFNTGRTTGIVIDVGFKTTEITPIVKGVIIETARQQMNLGGYHITNKVRNFLREQEFSIPDEEDQYYGAARTIKEHLCYVALDYKKELDLVGKVSGLEKIHELPNGERYRLGKERFMATELLFSPKDMGFKESPLHHYLYEAILACDVELQTELLSNIVLTGGTTMIPGFKDRLKREFKNMELDKNGIVVYAPPNRSYSVWLGGSTMSSLKVFNKHWIGREEYETEGISCIDRCL